MEETSEYRSVFAVWRWPKRNLAVVIVLALMPSIYLLSYAPLVKFRPCPFQAYLPTSDVHEWWMYRPANWLIDHTPLQTPLLKWAALWGVEHEFAFWTSIRAIDFSDLQRDED